MTKLSEMTKSQPDAKNFAIIHSEIVRAQHHVWTTVPEWTLVEVQYPDVSHLDGRKILVFEGDVMEWLYSTDFIDPHFEHGKHAPIARFNPVQGGWNHALRFCRI